ncbi:twin-arginine translocase TatA/TatE family subunit [Candidatus Regiella insecticola]|nr:twin-arginine translocase TatA/TatE family subunit [Candidatus Regiella insecticola]
MGGISIWQLIIIAVIVALLFGTSKLRSLGSDLGASLKGFKKAIGDDATPSADDKSPTKADQKSDDADFLKKIVTDEPLDTKTEKTKNNKEQV